MPRASIHPLISVIVPTWNAADFLPATLETIFSQTWPAVEIIVVDDGSTDGTADFLAGYGDRIKVVSLTNSGGPSRPRNFGVKNSKGKFVAFFDSDDLMEPDKLSCAMEVFAAHPEVDFVSSNFRSINVENEVLKDDYLAEYSVFRKDLKPTNQPGVGLMDGESAFRHLLRSNFVGTSSVVCRRDRLMAAGPFIEEMKNSDDVEMWRRLAHQGCTFAFVDRVLHSYRITPDGISARGAGRFPAMIMGLESHLPNCSRQEDRDYIQDQVRHLHFGRAWVLRRAGQYPEAIEAYRTGLNIGWNLGGFVGLIRTWMLALLKQS